jgi:4-hydroxybenzoate polyprenyltransferase
MSQQIRAIQKTAIMLVVACLIAVIVPALLSLNAEVVGWILMISFCAFSVWILYSINLGQIKHDDQLAEMQQRHEQAILNKQV